MKSSGIGGQAVLEGVMMKNGDAYAVAVRKPDGEIEVDKKVTTQSRVLDIMKKIPIIRGVINFVSSLVLGMTTLTYSASFYEEEEKDSDSDSKKSKKGLSDNTVMGLTVAAAIVIAVVVFMILPYGISLLFEKYIPSVTLLSLVEGIIRMVIFIIYIMAISLMEDIKRVYMYHGAEHKCINCIEHGLDLTVENVRKSSKEHKRCGTSFLLLVMVVSIIVFAFIRAESPVLRLVLRLLLVPVVAGIAYEFIRLAGRSDNIIVNLISKPGLMLQKITTKEPDDSMIEVGIASVEAVFDWQSYIQENFQPGN